MSGLKRDLSPDRDDDERGKRRRQPSEHSDDDDHRPPSTASSLPSPSAASAPSSHPPTPSSSAYSPSLPSAYAGASGGSTSAPAGGEEEVRLLIENSQVGGLIGRGGTNVSSIREQSGAHVSILKMDPRAQDGGMAQKERIATVKGPDDAVIKAIKLIADMSAAPHLTSPHLTSPPHPTPTQVAHSPPPLSLCALQSGDVWLHLASRGCRGSEQ